MKLCPNVEMMLLGLFAVSCGAQVRPAGSSTARGVPMKTFRDAANGVFFQYPAAWVFSRKGSFYDSVTMTLTDAPEQPDRAPLAVVTFSAAGNYYARTNLSGLDFTYDVLPGATEKSCEAILVRYGDDKPGEPNALTIHGTAFRHASSGGAGMCHQMSGDIYTHFQGGKCFVFQAGMHTICPGVKDGTRTLTAGEVKALQRHLDAVIQTVTINAPR